MTWEADGVKRGYKFMYDGRSRLLRAVYGEGEGLNVNQDRFNEEITGYDKNGNILGIKRCGKRSEDEDGLIDNLVMSYNGNQLKAVSDSVTGSAHADNFEFKDGADLPVEYYYDSNGNLIQDLNKKISEIQYNCLNLPSRIEFEDGGVISYLYDAKGTKFRTTHVIAGKTTTTDYFDDAIYENGVLTTLLTELGYISLVDGKYHYYLKDHQGNNRVVVDQNGSVEEVNHYYPFGGTFALTSSVQPYKYNGKELDRQGGLDWYDYGARHYDAALGRWHVVDPLAEKYYSISPYAYCGNNPIMLVDVNGKEWGIVLNANGTKTVTLAVNFNVDSSLNLTSSQINAYKTAISTQLNNTFQEASGGMVSTAVTFYSGNENISQSLSLGKMDGTLGGGTTYFSSSVNLFNPKGELRSLSNIASDATHEVLHTLRLGHPFELTQTADTELVRVAPNSFVSTSTTDKNIVNNIMNYPQITIDGMKGYDLNMLTKGQLNYILNEINLQKRGYGFVPKYNSVLTPEQNANLYKQYYEDYWLNFPGTPVQNQ